MLLGFEETERLLERIGKHSRDPYPPYNIELIPASNGRSERMRIVLAVAGFTSQQLEVTVDGNQLTICGEQSPDRSRDYLYRGIATRRFQRHFVLAEGLVVESAELEDGLLGIEIARLKSEVTVKRVDVKSR